MKHCLTNEIYFPQIGKLGVRVVKIVQLAHAIEVVLSWLPLPLEEEAALPCLSLMVVVKSTGGVLISAETGSVVVLKQDTNSTVMIYSYTVVRSKVNMQVSKTLHTANTPRVFWLTDLSLKFMTKFTQSSKQSFKTSQILWVKIFAKEWGDLLINLNHGGRVFCSVVSASTILASIIRTDKESSYRLQDSLQLKDLGSINKVSLEFTCDDTISVRYRLINCLLDL